MASFRPLPGLYEPSAIQQLPDGRFIVLEDEKQHPFSLIDIRLDGSIERVALEPGFFEADDAFWKLDDLEGVALDQTGFIYAVTSHSRTNEGEEKKSRSKLVRFRVEGERAVDSTVVRDLKPALQAAHPVFAAAATVRDVKSDGGLNIEALEVDPDGRRLWLGFRSPLLDGRAILAGIENFAEMFEQGASPRIAGNLITLDLAGHGLRGMAWAPTLKGYLLVAGPVSKAATPFSLWFWSGGANEPARRVDAPGVPDFAHAEGVCPAVLEGRSHIVVVSDDGDRTAGRCAGYLILDPEQLRIAP